MGSVEFLLRLHLSVKHCASGRTDSSHRRGELSDSHSKEAVLVFGNRRFPVCGHAPITKSVRLVIIALQARSGGGLVHLRSLEFGLSSVEPTVNFGVICPSCLFRSGNLSAFLRSEAIVWFSARGIPYWSRQKSVLFQMNTLFQSPYVPTLRHRIEGKAELIFMRTVAKCVVFPSAFAKEFFTAIINLPNSAILSPSALLAYPEKPRSKEVDAWLGKTNRVLFIGSSERHKGLQTLIDAVGLLAEDEDWGLLATVAPGDRVVPNNRTFLAGKLSRENISFCLLNSSVVGVPSLIESYSHVVDEAKLLGVPVVASDIPIFHERGGLILSSFSPGGFAKALASVRQSKNTDQDQTDFRLLAAESRGQASNEALGLLEILRSNGLMGD
jgi:glycosyltransferase involved in cell wall biosynthesis